MKNIVLALAAFTLTACGSVKIYSPNPGIEPSELLGESGFKFSGELKGSHETKATDDAYHTPPDMAHPSTNTAFDLFGGAGYSFMDGVEFGLEGSPLHGGLAAEFRFQPIGEGIRHAEEGNFSWELYLKGGQGQSHDDSDISIGSSYRGSIRESYVHTGTSFGYRFAPHIMAYAGAAWGQYWMRAEVDQPNNTYVGYSTGNGLTGGIGLMGTFHFVQFFVSGEFTRLQYAGADTRQDPYLHAGVTVTPGN